MIVLHSNSTVLNFDTITAKEACAAKTIIKAFRERRSLIKQKITQQNTQNDFWQKKYVKLHSKKIAESTTQYFIPKLGISLLEPSDNAHYEDNETTNGCDKILYKKDDRFVLLKYRNIEQFLKHWDEAKTEKMSELSLKLINQKTLYFSFPISPADSPSGIGCVIAKNAGPTLFEIACDKEYFKKSSKIDIIEFKSLISDLVEAEKSGLMLPDLHCKNLTRKKLSNGNYRINAIDIDCITKDENLILNAPQRVYPYNIKVSAQKLLVKQSSTIPMAFCFIRLQSLGMKPVPFNLSFRYSQKEIP